MAQTFAIFEGLFRLTFNGIDQDDLLVLLQDVHDEISSRCQFYDEATEDVTWSAADVSNGVRRWAVSANVRRIWDAHYLTSATVFQQLTRTNKHTLDRKFPGWRMASAGTPSYWLEDGGYIGLYPKPDTEPTAGYPKVTLYTFERQVLTTGSSLPGQVSSTDAWLYGCLFKYARSRQDDRWKEFEDAYKRARRELIADVKAINARDFAQMSAHVPSVTNL